MDTFDRASKLIKRYEQLRVSRSTWEQHFVEIDQFVAPAPNYFNMNVPIPGKKTNDKLFDPTATQALNRFVAAMSSTLTPRSSRWHSLSVSKEYKLSNESKAYLEEVTDILFQVRYSPSSNFAAQIDECYHSLGKFGTCAMFIDDIIGQGIKYKTIHLSQIFVSENSAGRIDTAFRRFKMSARAAYEVWGDACPEKILTSLKTNPDLDFWFLHAVYPNTDYSGLAYNDMRFNSCYICMDTKDILQEGGYRVFPYAVSRFRTEPGEIYGRGPAIDVLPEIKTLNRARKAILNSVEKNVNPPILVTDDGAEHALNLQANAINYGMIDENGRPKAIPFNNGARIDIAQPEIDAMRTVINDAFLVSLFQILVQEPQMTATEVQYRQQEKGELLAPTMGRQQSELLSQIIERELDILSMAKQLPPMPQELIDIGGIVNIHFDAPLNKIMRSNEAAAILQSLQTASGLAQFDPSVIKMFDMQKVMRDLCDIWGVPQKVMFDDEQIQQMQQTSAQQAQLQQILQAAPVVSESAKNIAQAQQAATSAGPAQNLGVSQ